MQNKNITVVGGTGFVGRYVIKLLAEKGYQIRVIAREIESALHIKTAGDTGQIVLVSGDITRPESLKGKLDNSYAVINLTGILYESGSQTFDAVHAAGPGKLAEFARQAKAERFIHVSALGVELTNTSRYAHSKALGEQAVRMAFPQATILRPSIIFGAEDMYFNKFAAMACLLPFMPLIGGGRTKFQPVYVLDVAQAIVAAVERDGVQGKIYELGGPSIYSFRDNIEFICKTINRPRIMLNVPFPVAGLISTFTGLLPSPPLTRDQVKLLKNDNVVSTSAKKLADLGITPQSVENIVPFYLSRFARKLA